MSLLTRTGLPKVFTGVTAAPMTRSHAMRQKKWRNAAVSAWQARPAMRLQWDMTACGMWGVR